MTTRVPVRRRFSSAATSRPLMCGISMSVMKTSGLCASTASSASLPLRAWATTEMSPSISSSAAKRAQHHPLIFGQNHADGLAAFFCAFSAWGIQFWQPSSLDATCFQGQGDGQGRAGFCAALQRAAEHFDALAHAAQSVAFAVGRCRRPSS